MSLPGQPIILEPTFIPIDIDSPGHRSVFQTQRVICGWKYEDDILDTMFGQMRKGERFLFWVCIPLSKATDINTSQTAMVTNSTASDLRLLISGDGAQILGLKSVPAAHVSCTSEVALPLLRSDKGPAFDGDTMGGAVDETSSQKKDWLVPVGHVSLDLKDLEARPAPQLGNGDGSTVAISTLFILPAYRGFSLASTAMRHAEDMLRDGQVSFSRMKAPTRGGAAQAKPSILPARTSGEMQKLQKCQEIALTTLAERHWTLDEPNGNQMWVLTGGRGIAMPRDNVKVHYHGPWYSRLGYHKVAEMPKYANSPHANGEPQYGLWWAEIWTKSLGEVN